MRKSLIWMNTMSEIHFSTSILQRSEEMRLYTAWFRLWQLFEPWLQKRHLQMHLLAEWFVSGSNEQRFSERGSQGRSNVTKSVILSFCRHFYSLWTRWTLFSTTNAITYYWTGLLILNHSYLGGNLTNSKTAETEALEPPKSWHFCISNIRTC
jgi:hypothetical protein